MINKNLTLQEINKLLPEITNQLIEARRAKDKAEVAYYSRFTQVILSDSLAGYRNQKMRDAQAKRICETEGLSEALVEARGIYADLYLERETLLVIARNLRSEGIKISQIQPEIKMGKG